MNKTKGILTPWFVRLGLYVIVAAVGLVLVALGIADTSQVDGWLTQVGGLAALIGGVVATVNTNKDSDKVDTGPVEIVVSPESTIPAVALDEASKHVEALRVERERAETALKDIADKARRVQDGEPIFSVFH